MNIEQNIARPYKMRLALWAAIVAALGLICYFYHASPSARFEPVISVVIIIFIAACLLYSFGILGYLFDKPFSGRIVDMKVRSKPYMGSALERKMTIRTFVSMTVECDNGKSIFFEQMLPDHLTKKIPYRVGDRVYHIKGAKHLCRFPRNDTETKYEPVSVICPLCGAYNPLGSRDCAFCESDLPYDPMIK